MTRRLKVCQGCNELVVSGSVDFIGQKNHTLLFHCWLCSDSYAMEKETFESFLVPRDCPRTLEQLIMGKENE